MIRARALSEPTAPAICRCCEPRRQVAGPVCSPRRAAPSAGRRTLSLRRVRPPRADSGRVVRGCASRVCMPGYVCSDALATLSFCGVKRGLMGTVSQYTGLISICYPHGLSPRGRGNPMPSIAPGAPTRPIPAWAGEPLGSRKIARPLRSYPRVGGGTPSPHFSPGCERGRGDGRTSACFASLVCICKANASQGAQAYLTVRRAPQNSYAAFNAANVVIFVSAAVT